MEYGSRLKSATIGVAAVLGLAACASGVRISNQDITPLYQPNDFGTFAAGDREIRVDVTNNPFPDVPQETFNQLVVDAMPGQALRYPINFSADPQVEYRPERRIRVMLVFDPPDRMRTVGLCRLDDIETVAVRPPDVAADPSRVRVLGAYCQGEATVTRATGTVPRGVDVASTNLDGLISQMTQTLFPIYDPDRDDDCPPFEPVCN